MNHTIQIDSQMNEAYTESGHVGRVAAVLVLLLVLAALFVWRIGSAEVRDMEISTTNDVTKG